LRLQDVYILFVAASATDYEGRNDRYKADAGGYYDL
jgi:hypothetical protein